MTTINTTSITTPTTSTTTNNNSKNMFDNATRKRKLILHVDVRNTIIVADSVTNINVEQALNSYLTGVLWGRECKGEWCWVSTEPSLTQPEAETITYYKYLERRLVTKPEDRGGLRIATGDFTTEEIGKRFRPYYEKHLELLKWKFDDENIEGTDNNNNNRIKNVYPDKIDVLKSSNYDNSSNAKEKRPFSNIQPFSNPLVMTVTKGGRVDAYHYILPSFVKFISHLVETNREFSIVIRTYGLDSENVLSTIKYICRTGNHPNFTRKSQIPVRTSPGFILRKRQKPLFRLSQAKELLGPRKVCRMPDKSISKFRKTGDNLYHVTSSIRIKKSGLKKRYKYFAEKLNYYHNLSRHGVQQIKTSERSEMTNENDICHHLNESCGVSGYVDDFSFWQNKGYSYSAGKPLWLVLPGLATFDEFFNKSNKNQLPGGEGLPICPVDNCAGGCQNCSSPKNIEFSKRSQNTPTASGLASVTTHHHIFFDDNIRVDDEDSIVDMRLHDNVNNTWRSLTLHEMKHCENVFLIQANLLESIENEDYFIEKVKMCERNLENILLNFKNSLVCK